MSKREKKTRHLGADEQGLFGFGSEGQPAP